MFLYNIVAFKLGVGEIKLWNSVMCSDGTTVDRLSPQRLALASSLSTIIECILTYFHEVPLSTPYLNVL